MIRLHHTSTVGDITLDVLLHNHKRAEINKRITMVTTASTECLQEEEDENLQASRET